MKIVKRSVENESTDYWCFVCFRGQEQWSVLQGRVVGEVREGLDGATAERMKLVILGSRKERDEEVDEA